MDSVVPQCPTLEAKDLALLKQIETSLPILADLHRADILLYCALRQDAAVVVAQAQPHSILPIHRESLVQQHISLSGQPLVHQVLDTGRPAMGQQRLPDGSALCGVVCGSTVMPHTGSRTPSLAALGPCAKDSDLVRYLSGSATNFATHPAQQK